MIPENTTATEPASGGSTEYINHHLHHLQVSVGDSTFMTLNVDTLFFTAVLSILFVAVFIVCARRATAGVPGKFQSIVEIIVGFVDGLVRETFHGRSKMIAPMSLTIFVVIFLMNFIDLIPVDFLPWTWANAYVATGHDPAQIVKERGLVQMSDEGELAALVAEIVAANPAQAQQFREGKTKVLGFFVGQLMQRTKGQANPQLANQLFTRELTG